MLHRTDNKYTSEVMTQNMLSVDAQEGVDAFIQKQLDATDKAKKNLQFTFREYTI